MKNQEKYTLKYNGNYCNSFSSKLNAKKSALDTLKNNEDIKGCYAVTDENEDFIYLIAYDEDVKKVTVIEP